MIQPSSTLLHTTTTRRITSNVPFNTKRDTRPITVNYQPPTISISINTSTLFAFPLNRNEIICAQKPHSPRDRRKNFQRDLQRALQILHHLLKCQGWSMEESVIADMNRST